MINIRCRKKCTVCGKNFFAYSRTIKYCSWACEQEAIKARRQAEEAPPEPDAVCPVCGKAFRKKQKTQVYCSEKCRRCQEDCNQGKRRQSQKDPKYLGWRCHDCGKPSGTYRCPACQRKFQHKHQECFA